MWSKNIFRSTRLHLDFMFPNSDPEGILPSTKLRESLAYSDVWAMGKGEKSSKTAWETVLNAEELDYATQIIGRVHGQQIDSRQGPFTDEENFSIVTVLQEMNASEVKRLA